MATKQYYEAAIAVVLMDLLQTGPALYRPDTETNEPVSATEIDVEACTSRQRADQIIGEDGSYNGRHTEDIYISAPPLAEILDVSKETARRRLRFFEKRDILWQGVDGTRLYYELDSQYRPEGFGNRIPSESEIADTVKKLMNAVEEE